ncbi:MAG: succinate dehydrogenase assembly factor 2, partial [Gammaproteobacteria bacterium]
LAKRHARDGVAGEGARDGSVTVSENTRLRWQCRRGMKELDLVLEGYLEGRFAAASIEEQQAFASLLNLPDPVLLAYIMGREQPSTEEQRRVIESLRRTTRN